jgi:hypothetical protein
MSGRRVRWSRSTAGVLSLLALVGCGGDGGGAKQPAATTAATTAADEPEDPAVAEARRSMLGAITVGSPAAPVDLRYDLKAPPVQGRPVDIEFAVLPEATILTLQGGLDGGAEGIEIATPADGVSLEKLQAGTVRRFTATVVPRTPGAHVLTILLDLELPTGPARRVFNIPVVVQTPAAAAAAAAASKPG